MLIQELLDLRHCIACKHNRFLIGDVLKDNYGVKSCTKGEDWQLEIELLDHIINLNWSVLPSTNYTIDDYRVVSFNDGTREQSFVYNFKKEYILLPDCSYKVVSDDILYSSEGVPIEAIKKTELQFRTCDELVEIAPCFKEFLNKMKLICKE